jgi:hypothetical protein
MGFMESLGKAIRYFEAVVALQKIQNIPIEQTRKTDAVLLLAEVEIMFRKQLEHHALGNYFRVNNGSVIVEQDVLEPP